MFAIFLVLSCWRNLEHTYRDSLCIEILHTDKDPLSTLCAYMHTHSKQYTQILHRHKEVHKHTFANRIYVAGFLKWPAAPFHALI